MQQCEQAEMGERIGNMNARRRSPRSLEPRDVAYAAWSRCSRRLRHRASPTPAAPAPQGRTVLWLRRDGSANVRSPLPPRNAIPGPPSRPKRFEVSNQERALEEADDP